MTPEKQASLIAEWLEQPPGTAPPEGVDPDALQAIYALRPDLAPAPRVGIDDILAGVSEGPFARTAEVPVARTAEVPISEAPPAEAPPQEEPAGQVIDLAAARRRRNRVWGAIGTMAAAALILFTVLPEDGGFENVAKDAPVADPVTASPEAVQTAEDFSPEFDFALGEREPDSAAPEEAPARMQRQEAGRYDAARNLSSADVGQDDLAGYGGLEQSAGGASYGLAPEDVAEGDAVEAKQELASLGYLADEAEEELAPAAPMSEPAVADYEDYADDDLDVQSVVESESSRKRDTRSWGREKAAEESRASSAKPSASTSGSTSSAYDAPAGEPEPIPTELDALRAAANPGDYSSSWYLRQLDDAGLDRVDAALSSGDYASLIDDPDPRVGQDFAVRAALASGSSSTAMAYVRRGKARSSANTPFLSRLYLVEGQLLEKSGDVEGAKAAYTTAANLNRAR